LVRVIPSNILGTYNFLNIGEKQSAVKTNLKKSINLVHPANHPTVSGESIPENVPAAIKQKTGSSNAILS
jgi:hypothetical protein